MYTTNIEKVQLSKRLEETRLRKPVNLERKLFSNELFSHLMFVNSQEKKNNQANRRLLTEVKVYSATFTLETRIKENFYCRPLQK